LGIEKEMVSQWVGLAATATTAAQLARKHALLFRGFLLLHSRKLEAMLLSVSAGNSNPYIFCGYSLILCTQLMIYIIIVKE